MGEVVDEAEESEEGDFELWITVCIEYIVNLNHCLQYMNA
jgi:hypothetical protein